jgi:4-hydroxyphenylpyruvate dioxygenase-like putative hemolysin
MGTDGFEFVEYAAPDPALLRSLFERWASRWSPGIAART